MYDVFFEIESEKEPNPPAKKLRVQINNPKLAQGGRPIPPADIDTAQEQGVTSTSTAQVQNGQAVASNVLSGTH